MPPRPPALLLLALLTACPTTVQDSGGPCGLTLYTDDDGDGYGYLGGVTIGCAGQAGLVDRAGDCDDSDPTINPEGVEVINGADDDCNGRTDEEGGGVCGDGQVTGFETCDGALDEACPGHCASWCRCPSQPPGDLQVHMIDVGQGDAVLVISPDGFTLLVDAGNDGEERAVNDYLEARGIAALDLMLASHIHADHIGGLPGVLAAHPEAAVCYDHGGADSSWWASTWREAAGSRLQALSVDDTVDLGPSVAVDVLHSWRNASNENLNSLVLRLTYGDTTVLLGGDCETEGCERTFDPGPIDVYKVHHHGSSDSSGEAILGQMQPSLALIPVGRDNDYGHPHEETVQALEGVGATILRTDMSGDLRVWSDGDAIDWESAR